MRPTRKENYNLERWKSFNGDVDRFKAAAVKQVIVYTMNNRCSSNLIAENEGDATIAMVVCKRCVS